MVYDRALCIQYTAHINKIKQLRCDTFKETCLSHSYNIMNYVVIYIQTHNIATYKIHIVMEIYEYVDVRNLCNKYIITAALIYCAHNKEM